MKNLLLLFILVIKTDIVAAGEIPGMNKKEWDFLINGELKYNHKKRSGVEAGINFTKYNFSDRSDLSEYGFYFTCEYIPENKKISIIPKIGFGTNGLYYALRGFGYCARLSAAVYNLAETKELGLVPEVGITYLGIVNLSYSNSFYVSKNNRYEPSDHTIGLGLIIGYQRSIINLMDSDYGIYDAKRFRKRKK